ncbi:MAG: ATP/GTP-binding protein [Candidatus Bathyarchaeota archaeon]|nr:ATP/GTP-binding protein [Candidatus Bathyarchaeota archaeon]
MNILILGPAGSGKTLLTKNFGLYLENEGYSVKYINLDPGVLETPYKADFDVREKFTVEKIMRAEGLGPNGAIIKAMDMLAYVCFPSFDNVDFTLIDTPGQLEPFIFRDAGRKIVEKLGNCICIFIVDLTVPRQNLIGFYLYSLVAKYTLNVETVIMLNKVDLLNKDEIEKTKMILENPLLLFEKSKSLRDELDFEVVNIVKKFFPPQRIPLVSAKTWKGFNELLTMLYEVKCVCGDLT